MMGDMEEQGIAAVAAAGEEMAAAEGGGKALEGVGDGDGEGEGEVHVKSVPNEELNSMVAHDVLSEVEPGEVDESVVAVAGSVDGSMEAPGAIGGESDAVVGSDGGDAAPSGDVVDATEKVESWDLSEAVAKNVQEEDSKPKFSEEGLGESVDAEDAPVASIGSIEDSVGEKPVAALRSDDVDGDSEGVSKVAGDEGSSREISGEGSVEKVESEAVDAPVEEVHEAVRATVSAEPNDDPESLEVVPSPSDNVEEKPVEVNSRDTSDVASVLPSQSVENEDVSPELPVGGPSDIVNGEAGDSPVDSEGFVPRVDDKVVEPTSIAKVDEGSLEPDSVLTPADDVKEKSTEVNYEDTSETNEALSSEESAENKDASRELPAEGPSDNVNVETLETHVNDRELEPVVDDTVVESTTSVKADEGSAEPAEPEPRSVPADEVEEKSIEVNPEVSNEANAVLPSEESAENKDISPELPDEGPSDKVDSETLGAPVDGKELEPVVDDKVVEPTTSASADEGSAEPEPVSAPADEVEEKSIEVNPEDSSEANAVLPSAEGSSDNVDDEALEAPRDSEGPDAQVVHEVVEPTTSAEADEGLAEPESVSPPVDVGDKSVEVKSEDISEANAELPLESAENKDVSPEHPAEGPSDNVDDEALEAPVDSEEPDAQVVHEVVEPAASAEADEGPSESEPVSALAGDVEEKSIEVNSEDTSETSAVFPTENTGNQDASPDLEPAEGSVEKVDGEALEAPIHSGGPDAQVVHEVVEPTISAQADGGSFESEALLAAADNVEEKSVEVKPEDTTEANRELPLKSAEIKDVSPEHSAEGPSDSADSEEPAAPTNSEKPDAQVVHEVVEPTTSAEADEGLAGPESVSAPADVEDKSMEVKPEDTTEANKELPLEIAESKDVSPEHPAEGPSDNVDDEALEAPVDSDEPDAQVVHEVVEPTTSGEADEGLAEPESVSAPVDVGDKSVEVKSEDISEANAELPLESAENKDVSPEHPAEGPSDNVDDEALEAPVDSEEPDAQVVHEVVEPAASAEADEGPSESEPVSALAGDVEEKSIEVNSEDTSETSAVFPTENTGNQDASPDLEPAEGSVEKVSKEVTLYAPVEEVHEVVEANNVEPPEESTESESVSFTPNDVEDKSSEVSEATTALASADNEVVTSEPPAEEAADNVSSAALEPEAVDEVVEPATSAEPVEESAEPESLPALDHVQDKSLQVASEGASEAATVLPSESADSKVSSELPPDKIDEIGMSEDVPTEAKHDEELPEPEFVSTPDATEDKSVNVDSGDITQATTEPETANSEVVSSQPSTEESADNVSSDALDAQAPHEVMKPTTSEEPVKELSEPEFVSAPSDNVEDKSVDVNSEDVTEVTTASESADDEDVRPKPSVEEPSENFGNEVTLYALPEEVHEVLEATIHAEPKEDSAEMESVAGASDDMEDDFVMVNSKDVAEASTKLESADNKIDNRELPAEESADNVSSAALEHEAVDKAAELATSAEAVEKSAEPKYISALDHDEDRFVEVTSEDTSEAATILPSGSAEHEPVSRDLPAEGTAENVSSETVEPEVAHEVAGPTTSAEVDERSAESESLSAADDVEGNFVEVNPEDTSEAATVLPSGSPEDEVVSRDLPAEGTAENVSETVEAEAAHGVAEPTTSAEVDERSAESESLSAADDVEGNSVEVNPEDASEAATVLPSGSLENEVVSRDLSAEGLAENVSSGTVEPEAAHEVAESTSAEVDERPAEPESLSAADDVEGKSVEVSSEDTGGAVTVLPAASAEDKVVSRDLPAEGTAENVSETVEAEAAHGVAGPTTSAEVDERPAEPESLSAADDVEGNSAEVNPEDTSEAATVLPSGSAEDEVVSRDLSAEGSAENVSSGTVEPEAAHEVAESTSAEFDERPAEPESLSAADDVEGKSVEVSSEDTSEAATVLPSGSPENEVVSRDLPAEGTAENVSETVEAEAAHGVAESTTGAEVDERSAEPESLSAADDVEGNSAEVNPEDTSEAATVLPSGSAEDEVVSHDLPAEGSAENVSSGTVEPEAAHEVAESTSAEVDERPAEPESLSAADDVEGKSVEVSSEDTGDAVTVLPAASAEDKVVSRDLPAEGTAENVSETVEAEAAHGVAGPTTSAEVDERSAEPESLSAVDDVEGKSVEVSSEDTSDAVTVLPAASAEDEVVSRDLSAEGTAENVSETVDAEAAHEVAEPTTGAEVDERSAEPESLSAADDVEGNSAEVNPEDTSEAATVLASGSAEDEVVSHDLPAEGSAENVSSGTVEPEAAHEVAESTSAEVDERPAEPESLSAADDVEGKSVEVSSEDTGDAVTVLPAASAEDKVVSRDLPAEGTAENVSETVEAEAAHGVAGPTTSAEVDERSAEPESLSAVDDVEGKSVEVNSDDTSEATAVLPSGSPEDEVVSRDLLAEGSADKFSAAIEETSKNENVATNAKNDESLASLEPMDADDDVQTTPEDVEPEMSASQMEESIMATSTLLLAEEQTEVSHEGSRGNEDDSIRVDTVSDTRENDTAEHASKELLAGADSGDAPSNPRSLSNEEPSDLSLDSHEKSLSAEDGVALVDRCIQMEELPQHIAAESLRSVSADTGVNAGDEETIAQGGYTSKEGGFETEPVSANGDLSIEDVSHMLKTEMTDEEAVHAATPPVKDVSHMLQTEMTDKEVNLAAAHHPENNVALEESVEDETPALKSESSQGEPLIPPAESSGALQANEVETVSREFSEAPTTSGVVQESNDESHDAVTSEKVTPYLATALASASGEKGNSSVAATSDTSPLETSNPPPVVANDVAPKSYNLDEVAHNLHDAAEKTLEDAKSSKIEDGQTSVAQSVAQIVLDESSKSEDPLEYISGVVQDVAQLAQNAAQSDPNILPDTVARVFDDATGASPTNEASPAKESPSLGNMFSLFIVWCVSLCASRISSKNMPAPALKLAAEEVTAVLHTNAPSQPAPSHEAASSNH